MTWIAPADSPNSREEMDEPAAVEIENFTLALNDNMMTGMRVGGGFVARLNHSGLAGASRPS